MDLLICAAECLDVHVVNGFPNPTELLLMRLSMLPAFLGTAEKGLGHIWKNYSSGDIERGICIVKPNEKHFIIFWMSSSSRLTLLGATSLCDACSPPWSPYIVFKAEVIDLCSCIVKKYRSELPSSVIWRSPLLLT